MSEVYGASGPAGTFDDTSLANLDDTEQKQLLGETMYPMIEAVQPELAGKITGMLLEMQVGEVVAMLNSQDELLGRIAEALDVLEEEGLILAAADARSTAAASVLPTSIATEDAPVVAAAAAASTTPAAVSPGGPPIDDDEDSELLRLAREQKEVLRKKLHKRVRQLAPEREALPVVGALLALENEVLQALLRNRQSLTAAMDAMRMHDVCDGIYDLLRAGLAMRRA